MNKLFFSILMCSVITAAAISAQVAENREVQSDETVQKESEDDFDDLMEGEGLTLEAKVDSAKEAVSGVSVVLDREQMKTTAQIGLVEDAMSSVATLPGVTYNGNWDSEPSIRGGYPREMATVLDGVYLMYPWHWGGSYSIFNPHMVDTVKMSNGVFSARYGRANSGLMEVTTVTPSDEFHLDLNITTIATDIFAQIPIGKKAGVFAGGKVTYMEGYIGAYRLIAPDSDLTDMLEKVPYIRDFYTKAFFNPSEELNFSLSGFYGSDGIGVSMENEKDGHKESTDFDYDVNQAFVNLNAKWLVTPVIQLKGSVSYNWMNEDLALNAAAEGKYKYTDEFITQFGSLLSDEARSEKSYILAKQSDYIAEVCKNHMIQGRLEGEVQLSENNVLGLGAEEVWSRNDILEEYDGWTEHNLTNGIYPSFDKLTAKIDVKGNNIWNTAAYTYWGFGGDTTLLRGELGARLEHIYIRSQSGSVDLSMDPIVNPRASVCITPWRNTKTFDKVTFSAGTGLFSNLPIESMMIEEKMNFSREDLTPNRAVFGVLGTELAFAEDYSFKLEAYYKYYLNRLFIVVDDRNASDVKYVARTDGQGQVAGFDLMLEKKHGEHFDGYLSYSFVYARYKNPFTKMYNDQQTNSSDPLDEWYYPSFHRFHTLNAVANFKPNKKWTFTLKGTFATGTPQYREGNIYCYPAQMADGTVIQRYTREYTYSDSCRTGISCPIDIRIGYKKEFSKKGTMEWYVGAEDIFLNLYSPEGYEQFDKRTGEKSDQATSVNFNIGIPMISTGVKVSF